MKYFILGIIFTSVNRLYGQSDTILYGVVMSHGLEKQECQAQGITSSFQILQNGAININPAGVKDRLYHIFINGSDSILNEFWGRAVEISGPITELVSNGSSMRKYIIEIQTIRPAPPTLLKWDNRCYTHEVSRQDTIIGRIERVHRTSLDSYVDYILVTDSVIMHGGLHSEELLPTKRIALDYCNLAEQQELNILSNANKKVKIIGNLVESHKGPLISNPLITKHVEPHKLKNNPVLELIDFNSLAPENKMLGLWELDTDYNIYTDSTGEEIMHNINRNDNYGKYKLVWEIKEDSTITQYLKLPNRDADVSDLGIEYLPGRIEVNLINSKPYSSNFGRYYYSNESTKDELVLYTNCYPVVGYSARRYVYKRVKPKIKYKGLLSLKKKKIRELLENQYKNNRHQKWYLERSLSFASAFWSDITIYRVDRGRYHLKAIKKDDGSGVTIEFYDKERIKRPKIPL